MKNIFAKLSALALFLTVSSTSYAALKHEGEWPVADAKVTLDFSGPRGDALKLIADKAGISFMAAELPSGNVSLHLQELPAGKAFDLVFEDDSRSYVATRTGNVVKFQVTTLPTDADASVEPNQSAAVEEEEEGGDRVIKGQSLRIEKGEVVHDVSVMGGSVHVFGKVTGDLVVTGGSVHVHDGAFIKGNATAIGGSLHVLRGARIDGNAGVVGGILHKEDGAIVKGAVTGKGKTRPSTTTEQKGLLARGFDEISSAVSSFGVLFVFGSILIALAGERMRQLRLEVATRPMRNFALGILGFFGFGAAIIVLCVTVIGIPIALFGALLGLVAMYAGIVAAVTLGGELLLRKRTENPYAHLALGALLFVALSSLPGVGTVVGFAVSAIGIGTMVSTRLAGFAVRKKASPALGEGPYRTNDV